MVNRSDSYTIIEDIVENLSNASVVAAAANDSECDRQNDRSQGGVIAELIVMILIFFTSVFGNALVIIVIATQPRLRTVGNVFIASLSSADILFGFIIIVSIDSLLHDSWRFGKIMCNISGTLLGTSAVSSLLHLMIISLNRYHCITGSNVYPRLYRRQNVYWMIFILWIISFVINLPPNFGWSKIVYDYRIYSCQVSRVQDLGYSIFLFLAVFVMPSTVCAYCYYKIFQTVRMSHKAIKTQRRESLASTNTEASGMYRSRHHHMTRFVVFLAFVLMWLPYMVSNFLDYVIDVPDVVHTWAAIIACLNSSVNPILYGALNRNFREGYKAMFVNSRLCNCKSREHKNESSSIDKV